MEKCINMLRGYFGRDLGPAVSGEHDNSGIQRQFTDVLDKVKPAEAEPRQPQISNDDRIWEVRQQRLGFLELLSAIHLMTASNQVFPVCARQLLIIIDDQYSCRHALIKACRLPKGILEIYRK